MRTDCLYQNSALAFNPAFAGFPLDADERRDMVVSIVTVALNEEEGLPRVLDALPLDAIRQMGHEPQVIVVDGGSTDKTRQVAHGRALVIEGPRGYGSQYRHGFAHARGEIIATLDADASYPAEMIADLVSLLINDDLDMLSVDRFADISPDAMSALHHFGNRMLTLCANTLFGLRLRDSQSGMWVLRRDFIPRLRLERSGMAFSEELKIEGFRKGRAREVPGRYRSRAGQAKIRSWRDGLGNLSFLFVKWVREHLFG